MRFSDMARYIQEIIGKEDGTQVNICLNYKMASAIELWSAMYRNESPWLSKTVLSANLAPALSSEIARLVTLEMKSEISGSPRADYLNTPYQVMLKSIRKYVEYGCAKGGLIIKPFVTASGIQIEYIQANAFFPLGFDSSGKITDCVFAAQKKNNKYIYTRLERHKIDKGLFNITNRVFRSSNSEVLGTEVTLTEVSEWSELQASIIYSGIDKLPFGYFKVPLANSIDEDSPLGVSVYSRSIGLIKEADKRYSNICWEYESKESAVHIASSLLKYDQENTKYKYPGGKERLYRQLEYNTGATDKPLIDIFSPEIRDSSLFNGFDKQLKLIEFNCNVAYGTLSDPQSVEKTAEEIKSSKQRSYTMVSDTQMALQVALEDTIGGMDFWATIYNLAPIGTCQSTFDWDDSIVIDSDKERQQDLRDVSAGIMRKEEYRAKWYGETEEQALDNLPDTASVME